MTQHDQQRKPPRLVNGLTGTRELNKRGKNWHNGDTKREVTTAFALVWDMEGETDERFCQLSK